MAIVIIKHEIPPKPKDGSIVKCKCKKKYTTFCFKLEAEGCVFFFTFTFYNAAIFWLRWNFMFNNHNCHT